MEYSEDSRFCRYVLEESYVLAVHVGVDWAVIELDVCLSKEHPEAAVKAEGDWSAFRPAQLWFKQAKVDYQPSGARPSLDADDSWDYGSIDRFEIVGLDDFHIEGEFGALRLHAPDAYMKEFSIG